MNSSSLIGIGAKESMRAPNRLRYPCSNCLHPATNRRSRTNRHATAAGLQNNVAPMWSDSPGRASLRLQNHLAPVPAATGCSPTNRRATAAGQAWPGSLLKNLAPVLSAGPGWFSLRLQNHLAATWAPAATGGSPTNRRTTAAGQAWPSLRRPPASRQAPPWGSGETRLAFESLLPHLRGAVGRLLARDEVLEQAGVIVLFFRRSIRPRSWRRHLSALTLRHAVNWGQTHVDEKTVLKNVRYALRPP
jgi:hypothetical protein